MLQRRCMERTIQGRKAGVEDLPLHGTQFTTTFATMCYDAGVDIHTAKKGGWDMRVSKQLWRFTRSFRANGMWKAQMPWTNFPQHFKRKCKKTVGQSHCFYLCGAYYSPKLPGLYTAKMHKRVKYQNYALRNCVRLVQLQCQIMSGARAVIRFRNNAPP